MIKRCIFHVPNPIIEEPKSGSEVRPLRMLESFQKIGYHVDVVSGYGQDRKNAIIKIKNKIEKGEKYSFIYSESNTIPTLLTEKNHVPLYPNLDFGFFKFCNDNQIPVGLFYRDIHWRFSFYDKILSKPKAIISKKLYVYDLKKYYKYVNCLFLPSMSMLNYIKDFDLPKKICLLPPGTTIFNINHNVKKNDKINLFYVGGIGELYQFSKLLECVKELDFVDLVICCRRKEWENNRYKYEPLLNNNIHIVHETGEGLKKFYCEADICMCYFKNNPYSDMAMPVKAFEYLSYCKPIIATEGTEIGKFVSENNIGWSIKYDCEDLMKVLVNIKKDRRILNDMQDNLIIKRDNNTWVNRAEYVKVVLEGKQDNREK